MSGPALHTGSPPWEGKSRVKASWLRGFFREVSGGEAPLGVQASQLSCMNSLANGGQGEFKPRARQMRWGSL